MKILRQLNPNQKKAVDDIYGPNLVMAGPGTGKTRILAARIMKMMLSEATIDPGMILALTYTEAGVVAMRQRLIQFMGKEGYGVAIHTFHGLCNEIIQNNPDYFGILDMDLVTETESIEFVKTIIDELPDTNVLKRAKGDQYFEVKRMLNLFRLMKDEGVNILTMINEAMKYLKGLPEMEEYQYKRANKKKEIIVNGEKKTIEIGDPKQALIDKEIEKIEKMIAAAQCLETYNNMLAKAHRYDYSDMIQFVVAALKDSDWMKIHYQERYQFVLVDEMQDTSGAQMQFLNLLLDFWDKPNIFAVGDLKQVIMEFSGARLANIIEFNTIHKPTVHVLDENYRSGQHILDAAYNVIQNNPDKLDIADDVKLKASRKSKVNGMPDVYEFGTVFEEEAAVFDEIKKLIGKVPLNEIAVIYRKHKHGDNLARALHNSGTPINIKKKVDILHEPIIIFLVNALEAVQDLALTDTRSSIRLMAPILFSKFSGLDYREVIKAFHAMKSKDWDGDIKNTDVMKIWQIMVKISAEAHTARLVLVVEKLMTELNMISTLDTEPDRYQQISYLHTFMSFVKDEIRKDPFFTILDILTLLSTMRDNEVKLETHTLIHDKDGINFLTAHGAKGLEFKKVFLIGCTRNEWEGSRSPNTSYKTPPSLNLNPEDKISTNRRLFYVAMTRAEDSLTITYASHNNQGKALEPSQFIEESGLKAVEASTSDQVVSVLAKIVEPDAMFAKRTLEIEKKLFDEFLEHYTLSISHVNKYLRCQVAFFYENILRIPFVPTDALIFGNATHRAIQQFYNYYKDNGKDMSLKKFIAVFEKDMERHRGLITAQEFKRRMSLKPVLEKYYNKIMIHSNKVTLNEFKVKNIVIDGIPFTGDFDKLEFDGPLVDVVDYKTGKMIYTVAALKPPTDAKPNGGDYWRQLVAYKIMVDNIYWKPWKFRSARVEMIDVDYIGPLPLDITADDEQIVLKQMHEVYDGIKAQRFSEGCGEKDCKWCNLK